MQEIAAITRTQMQEVVFPRSGSKNISWESMLGPPSTFMASYGLASSPKYFTPATSQSVLNVIFCKFTIIQYTIEYCYCTRIYNNVQIEYQMLSNNKQNHHFKKNLPTMFILLQYKLCYVIYPSFECAEI